MTLFSPTTTLKRSIPIKLIIIKMLAPQSPLSAHQLTQAPNTGRRRPLQPKNSSSTTTNFIKPKPNASNWLHNSNKENIPPIYSTPLKISDSDSDSEPLPIDSFESTLADELNAVREKLERLRIDKDNTDKLLKQRALLLDLQLNEIVDRGEEQKQLEIEVDRLYRLKEIKLACMRICPIRSLRDKEQEKKMKQEQLKALIRIKDGDEENNERPAQESEFRSDQSIELKN